MRTYYPGGEIIDFDSWMGYPRERAELLGHIKRKKIEDVVFVTGDIHTFIAGDVRLNDKDKRRGGHGVRGRVDHLAGLGEGGGGVLPGADPFNPKTPQGIILALQGANPWVQERGLRPPRLRPGGGLPEGLPLHAQAGGTDQEARQPGPAARGVQLARRSRAAEPARTEDARPGSAPGG